MSYRTLRVGLFLFVLTILPGAAKSAEPVLPGELQQAIMQAYRSGSRQIVIPPGTYRLAPTPQGPHLWLENLSDFEIDATGARLIFTDRTRAGIEFDHCRNVHFRGATLAYEIPPFTQGAVEAISPDGRSYDIRIDDGYPADLDDPTYFPRKAIGYLFDPKTRWWKPGALDLYGRRTERLGPRRFRVYWSRPLGPDVQPVAVGDLIAFRGSGPHNVLVLDSQNIELTGVTIYNAPDFAVLESGGEGGNHYTFDVERGPGPAGESNAPLLSSNADAFHSVNVRRGPVLEDCHFESMGDDGIAIHGTFSYVMEASGDRLILSKSTFRPGDPIRLFDTRDRPAGEAIVQTVAPLGHYESEEKSRRSTLADNTNGPYFAVTIRPALPVGFDYLATNPAAEGSGYVVRNNTIRNHRARGMLLKAEDGLVEGNLIDGSTMGGIVLSPEFWWNEAGYSRHVIVRDNTIRHVAYAPNQLGGLVLAALDPAPVEGCGNEDIRIERNQFVDIDGVNLLITSACGIFVRQNQFLNPQRAVAEAAGEAWGEDPRALVVVTKAKDVDFEDNVVSGLGPFNKVLLKVLPLASARGMDAGLRLQP
jgi:hypothetical protein